MLAINSVDALDADDSGNPDRVEIIGEEDEAAPVPSGEEEKLVAVDSAGAVVKRVRAASARSLARTSMVSNFDSSASCVLDVVECRSTMDR